MNNQGYNWQKTHVRESWHKLKRNSRSLQRSINLGRPTLREFVPSKFMENLHSLGRTQKINNDPFSNLLMLWI